MKAVSGKQLAHMGEKEIDPLIWQGQGQENTEKTDKLSVLMSSVVVSSWNIYEPQLQVTSGYCLHTMC